ncbi:Complexin, partial [Habropoda laboriosa]
RRYLTRIARVLFAGAVGGEGGDEDDKEKEEEAERDRLEAMREAEERRKEKHRKMEEEREKMRQMMRDKPEQRLDQARHELHVRLISTNTLVGVKGDADEEEREEEQEEEEEKGRKEKTRNKADDVRTTAATVDRRKEEWRREKIELNWGQIDSSRESLHSIWRLPNRVRLTPFKTFTGPIMKYNIKKREEIQEMTQEEPNPLMRKKKTPEELAAEAEAEDEDEITRIKNAIDAQIKEIKEQMEAKCDLQ